MSERVDVGELVSANDAVVLDTEGFVFTPTGLVVEGSPTYEQWEAVGRRLQYVRAAVHWWIGDWLNEGEARWGERYAQAVDLTGYTSQTLMNDKWVASRVQFSRRREELPFSHHAEVAALEPRLQDELLELAAQGDLTRQEFREAARLVKSVDAGRAVQWRVQVVEADGAVSYLSGNSVSEGPVWLTDLGEAVRKIREDGRDDVEYRLQSERWGE